LRPRRLDLHRHLAGRRYFWNSGPSSPCGASGATEVPRNASMNDVVLYTAWSAEIVAGHIHRVFQARSANARSSGSEGYGAMITRLSSRATAARRAVVSWGSPAPAGGGEWRVTW